MNIQYSLFRELGLRIAINLVAALFLVYAINLYREDNVFFIEWCREDRVIENLQVLFYAAAAGISFYLYFSSGGRNKWLLFLSVVLFIFTGEEISWGQRIFHMPTPQVLSSINVRHEITLHNIKGVHSLDALLMNGFLFILAVWVPLTNRFSFRMRQFYERRMVPVFPLWVCGMAVVSIVVSLVPDKPGPGGRHVFDEIGELFMSFVFLLAVSSWKLKQTDKA